jgi:formylmethanofuran dehydrogenase subunit B
LRAARYAVLVWEPASLPAHAALWAEMLQRLVATLNRHTRAATLALGGGDGAASVNQVFTWLSGLPLRTRAGPDGLEHEALRFDAARLLADRAVDGLLWISSFDPSRLPPATGLPRIVLGPPPMGELLRAQPGARDDVFIPVATPGLNALGHLFRTDGLVVVPLVAARDDGLAGVAQVLARLGERIGAPP